MKLNYLKELHPVLYGSGVVKILDCCEIQPNSPGFRAHWHERMEMLRVVSGELVTEIGGENITVKANEIAIIPPCRVHSGKAGKNGVVYETVMFDIAPLYNNTPVSKEMLEPISELKTDFAPVTSNTEILSAIDSIISHKNKQDSTAALLITAEIYKIIGLLYRHCLVTPEYTQKRDERLEDVLNYINLNFLEDITSSSLCQKFGYSHGYFCRRFKEVTGITPSAYVRTLRLEEAKKMLADSRESIGNISVICGFGDLSYFSRCFKKEYGISPIEYAKSERKYKI